MIQDSALTEMQKARLTAHFNTHPIVESLTRRLNRRASQA